MVHTFSNKAPSTIYSRWMKLHKLQILRKQGKEKLQKGFGKLSKTFQNQENVKINLKWKPGSCNHGISISSTCMSRGCREICSAITLKKNKSYIYIVHQFIQSDLIIIMAYSTPVAKIVEAAWNRCSVPSSIFNAITPWQLPGMPISEWSSKQCKNYLKMDLIL